jgi:pimeloyl-ACP methyl ester carboxylesterase
MSNTMQVVTQAPEVRTHVDADGRQYRYVLINNPEAQTLAIHFSAFFGEWGNARPYRFAYQGYFHRLRLLEGATQHHWLFLCDEYGAESNGTYYTGERGDLFVERAMQALIPRTMAELRVGAHETITMGSSMGATAALKFGLLLRARGIIAISPHIDLDIAAMKCGRERHVAFICPDGRATSEHNHCYTRQIRSLIDGWDAVGQPPPRLFVQVCQDDRGVYQEQVVPLVAAWKRAGGEVDLDARATGGHTSDWATRELLLDAAARILSGEALEIAMYQTQEPYLGRLHRPPLSHRIRRSISATRKQIFKRLPP